MAPLKITLPEYEVIDVEKLNLPAEFPFPYEPEEFSEDEKIVLSRFFTNVDKPVFAIKNLDQEIVGALLSKYSRSTESVRRMFLKFYYNKEVGLSELAEYFVDEAGLTLEQARKKSRSFYDRVYKDPLAEFGDDSVIQMGSCHVCFEYVSQIAAKAIEDGRIGVGYIEKSTRYINFRGKENNHYLYMESPEIMNSEFADEYRTWNDSLFDCYSKYYEPTSKVMRAHFPMEEQTFTDKKTGKEVLLEELDEEMREKAIKAYEKAIDAKTLDTIRVFLPTTTVTNLGAHLSGQAAEHMINKMMSSQHSEVRLLGVMAYNELMKVIPSFLSNIDYHHGDVERQYLEEVRDIDVNLSPAVREAFREYEKNKIATNDVDLVWFDDDADWKIASEILYLKKEFKGMSLKEIVSVLRDVKTLELEKNPRKRYSHNLAKIIQSAVPKRTNRRHKLPRVFEVALAAFEAYADWGIFRDLQRNRMNTTLRQELSAEDIFVPEEFYWEGMEEVRKDYFRMAQHTKDLHRRLRASGDSHLMDASEYVTIFGNKVRFSIIANLRQWIFFGELRTIEGGHPTYRILMQKIMRKLLEVYPYMKNLASGVNWTENVGLGRLRAEFKTAGK